MIWNEEIECMAHDELKKLQLKRLQDVVKRAYETVPYYKNVLMKLVSDQKILKPWMIFKNYL